MSNKPQNENDVVIINLDRPRELRFGYKALKNIVAASGVSIEDMSEGNIDLAKIEIFMYYGLLKDAQKEGENLQLSDMEDLLDQAESFNAIMDAFTKAIGYAYGDHVEGNEAGK